MAVEVDSGAVIESLRGSYPHWNSNGLFLITRHVNTSELAVYRSTDSGATWTERDSGNRAASGGYWGTGHYANVCFAIGNDGTGKFGISRFQMATDLWLGTTSYDPGFIPDNFIPQVSRSSPSPTNYYFAVLNDGDKDKIMGTSYRRPGLWLYNANTNTMSVMNNQLMNAVWGQSNWTSNYISQPIIKSSSQAAFLTHDGAGTWYIVTVVSGTETSTALSTPYPSSLPSNCAFGTISGTDYMVVSWGTSSLSYRHFVITDPFGSQTESLFSITPAPSVLAVSGSVLFDEVNELFYAPIWIETSNDVFEKRVDTFDGVSWTEGTFLADPSPPGTLTSTRYARGGYVQGSWLVTETPEIGMSADFYNNSITDYRIYYTSVLASGVGEVTVNYALDALVDPPEGVNPDIAPVVKSMGLTMHVVDLGSNRGSLTCGVDPSDDSTFVAYWDQYGRSQSELAFSHSFPDTVEFWCSGHTPFKDLAFAWQLTNGDVYTATWYKSWNDYHNWTTDNGRFINGPLLDPELVASPGVPPTYGVGFYNYPVDNDAPGSHLVFYHAPDGARNRIEYAQHNRDNSGEYYPFGTWYSGFILDPTNTTDDEYFGFTKSFLGTTDSTSIPGPEFNYDDYQYFVMYTRDNGTATELRHTRVWTGSHFPLWTDAASGTFRVSLDHWNIRSSTGLSGESSDISPGDSAATVATAIEAISANILDAYVIGSGTQADPWWVHISDTNGTFIPGGATWHLTSISLTGGDVYIGKDEEYLWNYGTTYVKHNTKIGLSTSEYRGWGLADPQDKGPNSENNSSAPSDNDPSFTALNPSDEMELYYLDFPHGSVGWNWDMSIMPGAHPDYTLPAGKKPAVFYGYPAAHPRMMYSTYGPDGWTGLTFDGTYETSWVYLDDATSKVNWSRKIRAVRLPDPDLVRVDHSATPVEFLDLSSETLSGISLYYDRREKLDFGGLIVNYATGSYLKNASFSPWTEAIRKSTSQSVNCHNDPNAVQWLDPPMTWKDSSSNDWDDTSVSPSVVDDQLIWDRLNDTQFYHTNRLFSFEMNSSNTLYGVRPDQFATYRTLNIWKFPESGFASDNSEASWVAPIPDPGNTTMVVVEWDFAFHGDILHIVVMHQGSIDLGGDQYDRSAYYSQFDTSTDTFNVTNELVFSVTVSNLLRTGKAATRQNMINVKSDGRPVFQTWEYASYTATVGTSPHHTIWERSLGGTWSSTNVTFDWPTNYETNNTSWSMTVGPNDRIHTITSRWPDGGSPASREFVHRSLPDGGSWDTPVLLFANDRGDSEIRTSSFVQVDGAGDSYWHVSMPYDAGSVILVKLITIKLEATVSTFEYRDLFEDNPTCSVFGWEFDDFAAKIMTIFAGVDGYSYVLWHGDNRNAAQWNKDTCSTSSANYSPYMGYMFLARIRDPLRAGFAVTDNDIMSLGTFYNTYYEADESNATWLDPFIPYDKQLGGSWNAICKSYSSGGNDYIILSHMPQFFQYDTIPNLRFAMPLVPAVTVEHTFDVRLKTVATLDHTFDVILNVEGTEQTRDHTFDVVLNVENALDHTFDVRINNEQTIDHTFDVILLQEINVGNVQFTNALGSIVIETSEDVEPEISYRGEVPTGDRGGRKVYRPTKKVIDRGK